jgi:ribosome biogenesis GTPase A
MNKALNNIKDLINQVDVVVEVRDARIPITSSNPELKSIINNKPLIIILNKSDLSTNEGNDEWIKWYQDKNQYAILTNTKNNRKRNSDLNKITEYAQQYVKKSRITKKPLRVPRILIVGIPNVGKSSFINYITGKRSAKIGAKPGLTRGKQMISISNKIQIVDTPGVLWPKIDSKEAGMKLASIGSIKDSNYQIDDIIEYIVNLVDKDIFWYDYVENYAKDRNFLLSKGKYDTERAKQAILIDFKEGRLGKFTLERPNDGL